MGTSLSGQKRFEEAEPLLLSGYQGLLERQSAIPAGSERVGPRRECGSRSSMRTGGSRKRLSYGGRDFEGSKRTDHPKSQGPWPWRAGRSRH